MKQETSHSKRSDKGKQLHIHIERWQNIADILDDRKKAYLLAFLFVVVGLILFLGISLIALQLKESFTYSDITTNALGTTMIKDEQKEVSYFLFNTAELWANSGIQVKKGDVISVHSSGRANTAIHHMYEDAEKNVRSSNECFDANGERVRPENNREKLRSEYRIFPKLPQSALLMQVCEETTRGAIPLVPRDGNPTNFYYIGAHRDNIHINTDGTLFFAINDIVLDSLTIIQMKVHNLYYITSHPNTSFFKYVKETLPLPHNIEKKELGSVIKKISVVEKELIRDMGKKEYFTRLNDTTSFHFGGYEQKDIDITTTPIRTEMDYYLEHKYKTAWYDDNVGSFLILVERNYRE